ncbi:MAG: toll/interleukin-1 receptor domain-containing protein [Anaerolineales bacterium]|nr:toll/interleukin-1 receptor domain-containing protein [Anaerolineales bacterium]
MTETHKIHVFLCHSSQDKAVVRELYQRLNAEGWIDAAPGVRRTRRAGFS